MEQRMHYYSEEENYELAASYRKNQNYIQKKMELLSEMEEKGIEVLSNQEYEDNFTMKDLEFWFSFGNLLHLWQAKSPPHEVWRTS